MADFSDYFECQQLLWVLTNNNDDESIWLSEGEDDLLDSVILATESIEQGEQVELYDSEAMYMMAYLMH